MEHELLSWPVPGLQRQAFYLTGSGALTREPPLSSDEQGIRTYVYPMGTELVGSNQQFALAPLPMGSLNYETDVMSEDLALLGTPILTFYFSSDQRDTDFLFTLKDIDARGDILFLQRAYLRASLRKNRFEPHHARLHCSLLPAAREAGSREDLRGQIVTGGHWPRGAKGPPTPAFDSRAQSDSIPGDGQRAIGRTVD